MTFVLTNQLVAGHAPGDLECHEGWCSNSDGTPVPYTHPNCGGIVHGDLLDQTADGWTLLIGCDKCDLRQTVVQHFGTLFDHAQPPQGLTVLESTALPAKKATKARKTAKKK